MDPALSHDPKAALLDLVSTYPPTALILADPAVSATMVAEVIPDLPASLRQIFLTGRWIERWHPEIATVDAAFCRRRMGGARLRL